MANNNNTIFRATQKHTDIILYYWIKPKDNMLRRLVWSRLQYIFNNVRWWPLQVRWIYAFPCIPITGCMVICTHTSLTYVRVRRIYIIRPETFPSSSDIIIYVDLFWDQRAVCNQQKVFRGLENGVSLSGALWLLNHHGQNQTPFNI